MSDHPRSGRERWRETRQETPPLEWAVAALGAAVVLGSIGFILYEALGDRPGPPTIEVRPDTVVAYAGGHVVEFRARNSGTSTAASVTIEGTLRSDTGTVETATTTLEYVPADATRRGGLFFSHDPRRYRLELTPKGYDRP